jgi:hypothetical protein
VAVQCRDVRPKPDHTISVLEISVAIDDASAKLRKALKGVEALLPRMKPPEKALINEAAFIAADVGRKIAETVHLGKRPYLAAVEER